MLVNPSQLSFDMYPLASATSQRDKRSASLREGATVRNFSVDELPQLHAEWKELALTSPSPHLFDLSEWTLAAFHAQGQETPFSAVACRHNSQLIGILPLVSRAHFLGAIPALVMRGFTTPLSPRCELIHRRASSDLAARMSWEALREDRRWRVLELPNVPERGVANSIADHARREGFRVHTLPALSTPIIDLRPEATTYLPNESRAYRARLEMKLHKLRQFGEVHLRSYTTVEEPLRRLLELEPTVRKTRILPLRREHPFVVELLREIGMWATRRDGLRIFALEINGEPISMLYGITAHDTFYALRIAHTSRLAMYSPGQLVVMLTLQELTRAGTKQCELVGPALPWKMVWTSTTRSHHSHFIFRPDSHGRTPLASLFSLAVRGQTIWRHMCGCATS